MKLTEQRRSRRQQFVLLRISLAWLCTGFSLAAAEAPAKSRLEWATQEGYRAAPLPTAMEGRTGFTLLSNAAVGIHFTNSLSVQRVLERQNLMNGSGLAAGDYDGDGLCDLYFCNKEGSNALYRNRGDWTFEDVTADAGVACADQSSTGATFADLNGDGRLDLLVTSFGGPNACLLNEGQGHFTNVTAAAQLLSQGYTTSQALGDLDGDGDLDLYVNNFGLAAILRDGAKFSTKVVNGRPIVQGRYANRLKIVDNLVMEFGEPDVLYLNEGQGLFRPVVWNQVFQDETGQPMAAPWDFGLAVQIRDINDDGAPDIYVCNDFQTPDRVWLNDGQGHFRPLGKLAMRNMSFASMGVDFADIDRDGHLDCFTLEMLSRDHRRHLRQSSPMRPVTRQIGQIDNCEETPRNALYWNRGDGTYAEIAQMSGIAASDWSWTPIFLDVDLDGYEDLLISNGHLHDVNDKDVAATRPARQGQSLQETRQFLLSYPRLDTPKAAFRNRGDLTFEDVSEAWGFNSRQIAHGMALADLDLDGDSDVILNCLNAPPLICRNDSPAPRLAVRLKGNPPNTQGIGAKIKVLGGPVIQSQEILCGGRYLSGDDPMRVFAAWHVTNEFQIEVTWRNGKKSVVRQARANFIYEIDEAGAGEIRNPKSEIRNPNTQAQNAATQPRSDTQITNHQLPTTNSQSSPSTSVIFCDGKRKSSKCP